MFEGPAGYQREAFPSLEATFRVDSWRALVLKTTLVLQQNHFSESMWYKPDSWIWPLVDRGLALGLGKVSSAARHAESEVSAVIQALSVTHGLNHPYTQDHGHPNTFHGCWPWPGMARDTNHPGFTFHHESTAPLDNLPGSYLKVSSARLVRHLKQAKYPGRYQWRPMSFRTQSNSFPSL